MKTSQGIISKIQLHFGTNFAYHYKTPEFMVIGFNIKLFRIAIEYGDFFRKTKIGHEEVWISKNANISVHKDKIIICNLLDDDLRMMLDITLKKFGNSFRFTGSDEFIRRALMIMSHDPKFNDVVLSDSDQQRKFGIIRNQIYMNSKSARDAVDKELFSEEMAAEIKNKPDKPYFKHYEYKNNPNQKESTTNRDRKTPEIPPIYRKR